MDQPSKIFTALGLMSGTSLDGIDIALIETDGRDIVKPLAAQTCPYAADFKAELRACLGQKDQGNSEILKTETALTDLHGQCVARFLDDLGKNPADIDLIGFHGHTIYHDSAGGLTWQIGNGAALADQTGIAVINDFRSRDVKAGGQGAPLLPLYHAALMKTAGLQLPVVILNIGGVANMTYIGGDEDQMLAFDTGPGNALIDDCVHAHAGLEFDHNGAIAEMGTIDKAMVDGWMDHPYFERKAPKSLDRDEWDIDGLSSLSFEDQVATLSAFTVRSILKGMEECPAPPKAMFVSGGGRLNLHMMSELDKALRVPVRPIDMLGYNGDSIEAEGFAYLAVRSHLGLPISVPGTTGVPEPLGGGVYHAPSQETSSPRAKKRA